MSTNEETVKEISKALGEPAFFARARKEAEAEAKHLPRKKMVYGLGLSEEITDGDLVRFDGEAAKYEYAGSETKNPKILSWKDAMKDKEAVALLKKYFKPENVPVLKNYYFAESLAHFGCGLVVIAEEKNAVFEYSAIAERSGADFIFIVAKENASLRVLETVQSADSFFFGRTVFAVAEKEASVEYITVQGIPEGGMLFQNKFSFSARGGNVQWYEIHAGNGFVKSDIEMTLAEEGAKGTIKNIALSANEHLDVHNASHHKAEHTSSHIFARGVAGSHGKIIYRGMVDIPKDISQVTGKQEAKFITVAPEAEIDALPALNVASPEVSSSHAVSVSHIKDTDLFFPALRGIPSYRAQALYLAGFLSKLLDGLPEEVQKLISGFINKKLSTPLFRVNE